jgi:hypothetical protein
MLHSDLSFLKLILLSHSIQNRRKSVYEPLLMGISDILVIPFLAVAVSFYNILLIIPLAHFSMQYS